MQTTNNELIAAITGGEIHRYGEIVQQFDHRVRASIASRVSDPATIDDLAQEAFYKAFKNLDRLEDSNRLGAWLVSIARNCVNDHFRKPQTQMGNLSSIETSAAPEFAAATWVWDEVEKLSIAHVTVLRFRYQLSLTYDEIAERLGVSQSTVRGRIFEARKALKKRLKDKGLFP